MRKLRIWRVETTHNTGYTAPPQFIETEGDRLWQAETEAIKIAKSRSRLSDFPQWTFSAILQDRIRLNGKWYTPTDYNLKMSKK